VITIAIDQTRLAAGSVLRGRVSFDEEEGGRGSVELSVLWETSGKGDTDLGVLQFETITNARGEHAFEAQLPLLPLTYDGVIVKIGWLVRARRGEFVIDQAFEVIAIA